MPNLYNLALRLLSIPASSSEIERNFSVAGIINKISSNMSDDLILKRITLKCNIKILDKMF